MSKSMIQSEEKTKQMIITSLRDIEWDIMQGKIDDVMTKRGGSAETYSGMESKKNMTLRPLGL